MVSPATACGRRDISLKNIDIVSYIIILRNLLHLIVAKSQIRKYGNHNKEDKENFPHTGHTITQNGNNNFFPFYG